MRINPATYPVLDIETINEGHPISYPGRLEQYGTLYEISMGATYKRKLT